MRHHPKGKTGHCRDPFGSLLYALFCTCDSIGKGIHLYDYTILNYHYGREGSASEVIGDLFDRRDDGGRVSGLTAGQLATCRDIGNIRMLEEGMGSAQGEHPVYGEGT